MNDFVSQRLGSSIGFAILVFLVMYAREASKIVTGTPYLMGALILCIWSVALTKMKSATSHRQGFERADLAIFSLAALQLSILGFLNTSVASSVGSYIHIGVDLIMDLLFLFACYYLVALADDENQMDGYKPVNFFGFPRSRKLLIVVFGGYCIFCPIAIMTSIFSLSGNPWIPAALKAANMSILMLLLLSAVTLILVASRYKEAMGSTPLKSAAIFTTACIVACASAVRWATGPNDYALLLSIATLVAIVSSTVKLVEGRKGK